MVGISPARELFISRVNTIRARQSARECACEHARIRKFLPRCTAVRCCNTLHSCEGESIAAGAWRITIRRMRRQRGVARRSLVCRQTESPVVRLLVGEKNPINPRPQIRRCWIVARILHNQELRRGIPRVDTESVTRTLKPDGIRDRETAQIIVAEVADQHQRCARRRRRTMSRARAEQQQREERNAARPPSPGSRATEWRDRLAR